MTEDQVQLNSDAYCSLRYAQYSIYERYAKKYGLGYKNLFVLRILYVATDGCTQMDICRFSLISKQTVSAIVKGYLSKGFVCMEEIPSDRRNKLVKLTDEGRKYADEIIPTILHAEHESMSLFSEAQQKEFIKLCSTYAENLKKLIK